MEWRWHSLLALMHPSAAQNEVAGYTKDGGKNPAMKGGKDNKVMPVSTAEYNARGWRA